METMELTEKRAEGLQVTQQSVVRSMLGVSSRDKIKNENIRNMTKVMYIIQKVFKLKIGNLGGGNASMQNNR